LASTLFREMVMDNPGDRPARRELGYTLACLGSISVELNVPDASAMLQEALGILEQYNADYPDDPVAIDSMIRIRLSMASASASLFSEEHNLAALDLIDQIARLGPLTPHMLTSRAHALNNIASNLTNREKTDEAELYWLEVLALREDLAKKIA